LAPSVRSLGIRIGIPTREEAILLEKRKKQYASWWEGLSPAGRMLTGEDPPTSFLERNEHTSRQETRIKSKRKKKSYDHLPPSKKEQVKAHLQRQILGLESTTTAESKCECPRSLFNQDVNTLRERLLT